MADSLADSRGFSENDSTLAIDPRSQSEIDSLATARAALSPPPFPAERARALVHPSLLHRIGTASLDRTADRTTTEILPWIVPLTSIPSGSPFVPDALDTGDLPGREPPLILVDGLPMTPPGWPESSPLTVDPGWLEEIRVSRPDPLRLPNDANGGLALELDLVRPESLAVISGARLSDGSADSNTDALYFVRPGTRSMTHVLWSDHKSAGRLEYGSEDGGNVLLRHERVLPRGTATLSVQNGFGRARVWLPGDVARPGARWLWDRSGLVGSWRTTAGAWEWTARGERTWHRFGWEGTGHPATRKSAVSRLLFTAARPDGAIRPRFTIEFDSERLRYYTPGRFAHDETRAGLGFAGGLEGVSKGWRYAVAAGRAEPIPGQAGLTASLNAERDLISGVSMQAYSSRRVRPRLLPRSGNDLDISVGQALAFPGIDPDPKLEVLSEVGTRIIRRADGPSHPDQRGVSDVRVTHEALELRWLRIDHAVLPDGGAAAFSPDGYLRGDLLPHELDQQIDVLAVHGDWVRPLGRGFAVDGWFALRTAKPGWERHLWMTPAEARSRVSWRRRWFGDLDLQFFVRGELSAKRAGRGGTIDPMARFDGGAQAVVGPWSAYLAWINLESDIRESATWNTTAMPLPLRSFRMGLVWRFSN